MRVKDPILKNILVEKEKRENPRNPLGKKRIKRNEQHENAPNYTLYKLNSI